MQRTDGEADLYSNLVRVASRSGECVGRIGEKWSVNAMERPPEGAPAVNSETNESAYQKQTTTPAKLK